jgi:hypothetical protein
MTKFLISRKCPKCQGIDFKRVKPERPIAFTDDRECKSCGTRYTPPTPLWASVVFIGIGVLILLVDIFGVGVCFAQGGDFWFALKTCIFVILTLSTGVGCIAYGLRCVRIQGDVATTDDGRSMRTSKLPPTMRDIGEDLS